MSIVTIIMFACILPNIFLIYFECDHAINKLNSYNINNLISKSKKQDSYMCYEKSNLQHIRYDDIGFVILFCVMWGFGALLTVYDTYIQYKKRISNKNM